MDSSSIMWLCISIGILAGISGGVIGTYGAIKKTNGAKERAFMIKYSVLSWIVLIAFLVSLFLIPNPYNFLLWIPYGVLLPLVIRYINNKQYENGTPR